MFRLEVAQNYIDMTQCETLTAVKDGAFTISCLQCLTKFVEAHRGFLDMQTVTRLRV